MVEFIAELPLKTAQDWISFFNEINRKYPDTQISFDPDIFNNLRNRREIEYEMTPDIEHNINTVFVTISEKTWTNDNLKKLYVDTHNILLRNTRRAEFLESRHELTDDELKELTNCRENIMGLNPIVSRISRMLRERGWMVINSSKP